jgi:hypothetical protein
VIDEILLHVSYTDGDGLAQETDVALNPEQTFLDWKVPVIGAGDGIVAYSGHIKYHNGTTVEIEETTPTAPTILVGDVVATKSVVTVVADLVDFTEVKLVKVGLIHGAHRQDFLFKPGSAGEATFELDSAKKDDIEDGAGHDRRADAPARGPAGRHPRRTRHPARRLRSSRCSP